jgi:hypothetical protein
LFLVLVHFARRKQLQAHVGFLLFFNRYRLREYTRLAGKTTSAAAWPGQRYIEFRNAGGAKVDSIFGMERHDDRS